MARSILKVRGLHTSPNPLSASPEGALKTADNCVINFDDTIEPRRGFEHLAYTFGTSLSRAKALLTYQGRVLVQYDDDKLAYDSGVAFVDYSGTYEPPDAALLRMKGAEIAQNFYFTTAAGIRILDAYNGTPLLAGLPRSMPPTTNASSTTTTGDVDEGWMPTDSQSAYIAVVGTRFVKTT